MSDSMAVPPSPAPAEAANKTTRTIEQQSARLRAAFVSALTDDDLVAIARKVTEQARDRDRTSARLVLKCGLGEVMSQAALKAEAEAAARAARAAALPTAEQLMATIRMRMAEQESLEAEIRGRAAPRPGGDRRPMPTPARPSNGPPPGNARR